MEKKGKAPSNTPMSDEEMVDKTLNNLKVSNESTLKSDTNLGIQAAFNNALGGSDMSEQKKGAEVSLGGDDDEGKATVVLDLNAMKAELEGNNAVPDVDLSFGDEGGVDIGSLDGGGDTSLQMDSLESASAESADAGGMDVDLSMGDMELTGNDGESAPAADAAPAMEMDSGLDLSAEIGALESSTGQVVEEEEEPMILNSDNNAELAAKELEGMTGDLNDSFSESPTMLGGESEELDVAPPDESLADLDFSAGSDMGTEEEAPAGEDNLFNMDEEEAPAPAAKKAAAPPPPPVQKQDTRTDVSPPTQAVKAAPKVVEVPPPPVMEEEEDMFAPPIPEEEEVEVAAAMPDPEPVARPAARSQAPASSRTPAAPSDREYATHQDYVAHHDDELMRLSATIRGLRDDRQQLLDKIHKLEEEKKNSGQDNITLKAELDEKKIEVTLIKKRHNDDLNHLRYQLNLTEDKRIMLEEKNRLLRAEFDKLAGKVRVDFNKIQSREKELENQLELLKADSEVQIRNRDNKIMDLKRKIDTLEFDMENIIIKENQSRNLQNELEAKLDKTIKTLRTAINSLETEDDSLQKFELIKKKSMDI